MGRHADVLRLCMVDRVVGDFGEAGPRDIRDIGGDAIEQVTYVGLPYAFLAAGLGKVAAGHHRLPEALGAQCVRRPGLRIQGLSQLAMVLIL